MELSVVTLAAARAPVGECSGLGRLMTVDRSGAVAVECSWLVEVGTLVIAE